LGSALGTHRLVAHPDTPAASVRNVDVRLACTNPGKLWLEYYVNSTGAFLIPDAKPVARTDGLWRSTCFELFVQREGQDGYVEFNFSPSFEWAAYEFDFYRTGMREYPSHDPEIVITPSTTHFSLAVEALPHLPSGAIKLALSAVIEETDGTKSYWALAHPPGAPDFHHPDCFALTLAAPDAA
jgi:hypothetical protein